MVRFQISLDSDEADILALLAMSDLRDPRDQVRYILRREFERLGLLKSKTCIDESVEPDSSQRECDDG